MTTNEALIVSLRTAARELAARPCLRDLRDALSRVVEAAVDTVPGADAGGISLAEHGEVHSRHPTTPAVTALDQLQADLREGPCITAIEEPPRDGLVLADDLDGADAARWPRFAPRAVESGYRSMLSTSIPMTRTSRAALNLYAADPHVFGPDDQLVAGLFGAQAAVLLYSGENVDQLNHAVASRDVIGQAKGILMERFTVDDDEAFHMLARSSQDTNMKLVEVSRWLQGEARKSRAERHAERHG
ncbi:GAF and ANTAR domain-containing protein [Actinomycetospora rhizophila]|uniref:GAF and ANTAR domain-containing protein n=1 Tax=Actinomycetospora rhizophila TaxID=1416876 RepID=A0ABV9ZPD3_9PSEU